MKIFLKKINKLSKGYTLIETMISVSIFIIIVMAGMGALLNANLLHNKSRDMRSILDNLSFTMEDMSRNLRTGYNYQCYVVGDTLSPANVGGGIVYPKSCASGWAIAFEYSGGNIATYGTSSADQWVYKITNGKIFKSIDGAQTFVQLTPDEVTIDQIYGFSVLGAEPPNTGDQQQPIVNIRLVGHILYKGVTTSFSLQTSVSQRQIDI